MKFPIHAGATGETIELFIQDATREEGEGLTGLASNSPGLGAWYNVPRGPTTAITLASLASPTAAWTSGGFIEIDAVNKPGHYRFDVPNALLASGNGRYVNVQFKGAANMVPKRVEISLTGWDDQAGSVNAVTGSVGSVVGAVGSVIAGVTVATNSDKAGYSLAVAPPTAAGIASAVWQDAASGDFAVAGSIGKLLSAFTFDGSNNVKANAAVVGDKAGYSLTQAFPANFAALGIAATGHLSNVDSLATYVGNVPQTGDAFAKLGAGVVVATNNDKAGYALSATGTDLVQVDGKTLRAALQIIASTVAGKISGAGSGTETFLGLDGATTRTVVTVDASGNRTNVAYS